MTTYIWIAVVLLAAIYLYITLRAFIISIREGVDLGESLLSFIWPLLIPVVVVLKILAARSNRRFYAQERRKQCGEKLN